MNIDNYLKRINCQHVKEPNLENLKKLHLNHIKNLPFENLDISLNKPVKMDLTKAYEKLIMNNRGGFCFELNYLFSWLLRQLGYEIKLVCSRVFLITSRSYYNWFSHVIIMVNLNNKFYLTDVGFSYPYTSPLEFEPYKVQNDLNGFMKIEPSETENFFTLLRCNTSKDLNNNLNWNPIYQFDITPRKIHEFENMLLWVQSPENPRFYNRTFCIRQTDNCLIMLIGFRLTKIYFQDSVIINREETELSKEQVMKSVKKDFNIDLEVEFEPKDILS